MNRVFVLLSGRSFNLLKDKVQMEKYTKTINFNLPFCKNDIPIKLIYFRGKRELVICQGDVEYRVFNVINEDYVTNIKGNKINYIYVDNELIKENLEMTFDILRDCMLTTYRPVDSGNMFKNYSSVEFIDVVIKK